MVEIHIGIGQKNFKKKIVVWSKIVGTDGLQRNILDWSEKVDESL